MEIIIASATHEYLTARTLFEEYAAALSIDLCFQDFAYELAHLPEIYGLPNGCLWLARSQDNSLGCVAVRAQSPGRCELKRLYVRPNAQGIGIGRALTTAAIAHARRAGYTSMVLDTLATMTAAQQLYASLGFTEIAAYYPNPLPGVRYMALRLTP